ADAALVIGPEDAELFQAAWWEPTRVRYGLDGAYVPVDQAEMQPGSGAWVHSLQLLNRPYTVPATGEQRPVELHELKHLPIGSGDPASSDFDQRTLVAAAGKAVEIRLPWALLGFADPSSLTLFVEHPHEATSTLSAERIGIAVISAGGQLLGTSGYGW